jgi:dynein assembly factor 1
MEMSQSALRDICIQHKLYRTPGLNDSLYCNHKGFVRLANLEPYCNLKALYLEGNVLRSLHGLPPLADLKCL